MIISSCALPTKPGLNKPELTALHLTMTTATWRSDDLTTPSASAGSTIHSGNDTTPRSSGEGGLSKAARAGIGVGVAALWVAIIWLAAWLFTRRRRRHRRPRMDAGGPRSNYSAGERAQEPHELQAPRRAQRVPNLGGKRYPGRIGPGGQGTVVEPE